MSARELRTEGALPDAAWSRWRFVLALVVIHVLGVALRCWGDASEWHGRPLLVSADGYAFTAGIRAALEGVSSRWLGPGDSALVALGWLVVKLTPLSIDAFAHAAPALLGPMIAWPVAALARSFDRSALGLVAAALAVSSPSFLGRTAAGYFDTDVFALTVPLGAVAAWLVFVRRGRLAAGVLACALLAAAPWFYEKARSLGLALAILAGLYLVVEKKRWGDPAARAVVAGLGLSQIDLPLVPRVALAALVPLALASPLAVRLPPRVLAPLAWLIALAALALSPAWLEAFAKLSLYAGHGEAGPTAAAIVFDPTEATISELRPIGVTELGARLLGLWPLAFVAAAGAAILVARHRALVVLAPFAALGLFALVGGARFAIYLTPLAALGLAWVIVTVAARLRAWRALATVLLATVATAPSIARDVTRPRRPVLVPAEGEALDALAARAKRDDVVIAWWDDGYPIAYWTGADPLIDGGRRGRDANLVAELLLADSQARAATLARALAEHARQGLPAADALFAAPGATLAERLANVTAPPSTRDVYLYLPARLLWMLPTIAALRPHDGERSHPRTFGPVAARLHGGTLEVGEAGGVVIDAPTATVIDGARREPLEALYRVSGGPTTAPSGGGPATGSGAKLRIDVVEGAAHAPTTGFYLPALGVYLELERALARSVLVQLLVFQRPEPEHFELVFGNDAARVYRLAR